MDAATLSSGLDIVAPATGQTLSVSEKAAVETSLAVLKADNAFDTVVFWGRIGGISADYLIAQGYNLPYAMIDAATSPAVSFFRCAREPAPLRDPFSQLALSPPAAAAAPVAARRSCNCRRRAVWLRGCSAAREARAPPACTASLGPDCACFARPRSTDGVTWLQLEAVDDATSTRCAALSKPFSGDASKVSVVIERGSPPAPEEGEEAPAEVEDDGEPAPEGYTKVMVTESMRLSYSIAAIDSSCACIPKGAMIMDANENVAPNRSFPGVDGASATDPASYCHFRPVANPKSIVKLGDAADPASDCFESLTDDVPTGCWSFKLSGTGAAVVCSNLLWPGFTGYAALGAPSYGYCYFGNGLKNTDIAFML
jgi:hypothetical protein